MKVLLSPAKALDIEKKINSSIITEPIFMSEAEGLIKKLSKFSSNKIGKMMSLSRDLSQLNFNRYQNWKAVTSLNGENALAGAAFNGEVYRGFDATNMNARELEIAQDRVRILSGLYGILKPLDVIYPYRLEMGTKWAVTSAKKNLYKFWGSKLAEALNAESEDGIIINLASAEYFKAVDRKTLKGRVITPSFKEFKDGDYKVVMVYAKKARGFMARYIVQNNISDPEQIKLFDTGGYMFDVNQSTEDEWVFTR
ncbi:MAG: peroxide stress protein YaaA [Crocinitomicaceae bacterium]|nr:peroxide stress protein YaaA [Crocinitomicaceae bacterium]